MPRVTIDGVVHGPDEFDRRTGKLKITATGAGVAVEPPEVDLLAGVERRGGWFVFSDGEKRLGRVQALDYLSAIGPTPGRGV